MQIQNISGTKNRTYGCGSWLKHWGKFNQNGMIAVVAIFIVIAPTFVLADDVYVEGYYRSDGTYVRSHIRSAPDGTKSNNYGPSLNSSQLLNPRYRDNDNDGIPNYIDNDDDNDGLLDDYDNSQYGG